MNTELTKITGINEIQGWILYDGECPICRRWVARLEDMFTKRGFDFAPLQAPWVRECLGPDVVGTLTEMRVFTLDGRLFGGADAVLFLVGRIWWAWPVCLLKWVPGGRRLLQLGYRWIAARRYCLGTVCDRSRVPVGLRPDPSSPRRSN